MSFQAKHRNVNREKRLPILRFREFSETWEEVEFRALFDFHQTNSFSRDLLNYENGQVRNIHYGDIHTRYQTIFDVDNEDVPFINESVDILQFKDDIYCIEGDLIIADASEDYTDIGKTIEIKSLDNQKVVAGLHTHLARPRNGLFCISFPGYLLQSWTIRKQIMMLAQGTKVLGISTRYLGEVIFKYPSIPEQRKITAFLSAVDRKIQLLTRKKELLKQYKKGGIQKIFSQEIRFKDENGHDYPEWEEKRLGYFINERVKYPEGNYPLYSLTIDQGMIPKSDRYERSFLVKKHVKAYKVMQKDDFAFNPMNLRFGALARLKEKSPITVSKYYNVFYCNKRGDPKYFEEFLTSHQMIQYYNKMATGSLIEKKRVHYLEFVKFQFHFPCISEQRRIAEFITLLDAKLDILQTQLNQMHKFKKGLLQQMFV